MSNPESTPTFTSDGFGIPEIRRDEQVVGPDPAYSPEVIEDRFAQVPHSDGESDQIDPLHIQRSV